MTRIVMIEQIKSAIQPQTVIDAVEAGFALYSQGRVVVPPVGSLDFASPPGDVHIKYGYIQDDDYYVIKIASGFYDNPRQGLPSNNGMMLVFNQKTGESLAILLDEGYLTDLRTGAAGAVAARHLAPDEIKCIGVIGAGVQARMQVMLLQTITPCRQVKIWNRSDAAYDSYIADMTQHGFNVQPVADTAELAQHCNLIITTTPSRQPLITADAIQPGTHITAVGSDGHGKQELDAALLGKADIIAADSLAQCLDYGEISHGMGAGFITENDLLELGHIISGDAAGRTSDEQITIADLTGVAIQDIQIAKMAYEALL